MTDDVADRKDSPSRPSPIDVHVGARIRLRRTLMGMSQERLGEALGLTFQQVQKYERGLNRVGASRLFDLAHVLGVEVGFFYEDMADGARTDRPAPVIPAPPQTNGGGFADLQDSFGASGGGGGDDMLHRRETLELVRTYYRITDPVMRRKVFDLIKTMVPKTDE